MITATLQEGGFKSRLRSHAQKLAQRKGRLIGAAIKRSGSNWRSASDLWPDLRLD